MTDLHEWALSFPNTNAMAVETGLTRYTCKRLRSEKNPVLRKDALQRVRIVLGLIAHRRQTRPMIRLYFKHYRIPKEALVTIKTMASMVVAYHKHMREMKRTREHYLTCLRRGRQDIYMFAQRYGDTEKFVWTLYQLFPDKRDLLFGDTGFIELMKSYGENYKNFRRFHMPDISPQNS